MNGYYLTSWLILLALRDVLSNVCSDNDVLPCKDELKNFQANPKFYYASSNEMLTEVCSIQKDILNCVASYVSMCFSEEDQNRYKVLTSGSQRFVNKLCAQDSELRKKYLTHSTCFKSVSTRLDNCSDKYAISQQQLDEDYITNSKVLLQKTCCIYFENIRCSAVITSSTCGEEAGVFMKDMLTQLGGTYLNNRCQDFLKVCSSIAQLTASSVSSLLVIVAIIFIIL